MENTKFGRVYTERPHMNHNTNALQEMKCLGFGKRRIIPDLELPRTKLFSLSSKGGGIIWFKVQYFSQRKMNASKVKYFTSSFENILILRSNALHQRPKTLRLKVWRSHRGERNAEKEKYFASS